MAGSQNNPDTGAINATVDQLQDMVQTLSSLASSFNGLNTSISALNGSIENLGSSSNSSNTGITQLSTGQTAALNGLSALSGVMLGLKATTGAAQGAINTYLAIQKQQADATSGYALNLLQIYNAQVGVIQATNQQAAAYAILQAATASGNTAATQAAQAAANLADVQTKASQENVTLAQAQYTAQPWQDLVNIWSGASQTLGAILNLLENLLGNMGGSLAALALCCNKGGGLPGAGGEGAAPTETPPNPYGETVAYPQGQVQNQGQAIAEEQPISQMTPEVLTQGAPIGNQVSMNVPNQPMTLGEPIATPISKATPQSEGVLTPNVTPYQGLDDIQSVLEKIPEGLQDIPNTIESAIKAPMKVLAGGESESSGGSVVNDISSSVSSLSKSISDNMDSMSSKFSDVGDAVSTKIGNAVDSITNAVKGASTQAEKTYNAPEDPGATTGQGGVGPARPQPVSDVYKSVSDLSGDISNGLNSMGAKLSDVTNSVGKAASDIHDTLNPGEGAASYNSNEMPAGVEPPGGAFGGGLTDISASSTAGMGASAAGFGLLGAIPAVSSYIGTAAAQKTATPTNAGAGSDISGMVKDIQTASNDIKNTLSSGSSVTNALKSVLGLGTGGYIENDMLAMLHSGEYVLPAGVMNGQSIGDVMGLPSSSGGLASTFANSAGNNDLSTPSPADMATPQSSSPGVAFGGISNMPGIQVNIAVTSQADVATLSKNVQNGITKAMSNALKVRSGFG